MCLCKQVKCAPQCTVPICGIYEELFNHLWGGLVHNCGCVRKNCVKFGIDNRCCTYESRIISILPLLCQSDHFLLSVSTSLSLPYKYYQSLLEGWLCWQYLSVSSNCVCSYTQLSQHWMHSVSPCKVSVYMLGGVCMLSIWVCVVPIVGMVVTTSPSFNL